MRIIESIKEFFRDTPVDRTKITMHLRRGTLEQIKSAKPYYVGDMVMCLDEPYLAIGTKDGFELIALDTNTKAVQAIRYHYSAPEWITAKVTW